MNIRTKNEKENDKENLEVTPKKESSIESSENSCNSGKSESKISQESSASNYQDS